MKITDNRVNRDVRSCDIPTGTFFSGEVSCNGKSIAGGIFFRTYNQIVLMDDPSKTWSDARFGDARFGDCPCHTIVSNYHPLNVELVITD